MAYQVNWDTRVITIPQSDLIFISAGIYKLDLEECHQELRRLEWVLDEGFSRVDILEYIPPLEAGGVIYARFVLLINGYTVTFEDGQYAVNFDGANTNIHDYTNVNQVSVRPNNSAGLQDLSTLLSSAYQGEVVIDINNVSGSSQAGTGTPIGTRGTPVNNIVDAIQIASKQNTDKLEIIGDITIGLGHNVSAMQVSGTSYLTSLITVETEALAFATRYSDGTITGILDGGSEIKNCIVKDLDYFNGYILDSAFNGRITLAGNEDAMFDNCKHLDIHNPPIIDAGESDQDLIMTNYSGQLIFDNLTGNSVLGIGLDTGRVTINSTCTAGTISIAGSGTVIDNSGDGCLVVDNTVEGNEIKNLRRVVEQLRPHHTGTGNIWFYDPVNGNDLWDGKAQERAFKTFAKAHDAVVDNNHDIIFLVPGNATGETITDENFHITKNYVLVRGPGRDFVTTGLITTSGTGTELSGFRINNADPLVTGMESIGAFTLLENLWFEFCTNGASFTKHHPLIHSCKFHGMDGYAVKMTGDISHGEIYDCTMGDAGETTIQIDTTATTGGIKMRDTVVLGSAGYGISLSATTRKFVSQSGNVVKYNALGNFNDLGTDNVLNIEHTTTEIATETLTLDVSCP